MIYTYEVSTKVSEHVLIEIYQEENCNHQSISIDNNLISANLIKIVCI